MEFKIFVSYSTKDLEHVDLIKKQLDKTPIKAFIAEHSVKPSDELAKSISKAITECDYFVLLWSENAKSSDWVSQEIGKATALNKKILPIILNENLALPGFISGIKYISAHRDIENAIEGAINRIMDAYKSKKQELLSHEKKQKDNMALFGITALVLWAMSKNE